MDIINKEQRSRNMAQIRAKDTKPELLVRRFVHSMGFRYRLHRRDLPGTPDLVFPRHRKVIFVHGCFWHRHLDCRFAYTPKSNTEFWSTKFARNVENDRNALKLLVAAGWNVLILWECEIQDTDFLDRKIREFLF